jgi:hypothetical protein
MRSDIVPAGVSPDYEQPDHINTNTKREHTWSSRGLGRRRPVSLPRLEQVESATVRGRA